MIKYNTPCRYYISHMNTPTQRHAENPKLRRVHIQEYTNALPIRLMVSVFNTETIQENRAFIRKNNTKIQCIYCSPVELSAKISKDIGLAVLEMNNSTNKIVGIGLIINRPKHREYNVYGDGNYNRFQFLGKNHIAREEMTPEEQRIMTIFDILCFTGNQHLKRTQGVKSFPLHMLYNVKEKVGFDLVDFIYTMFKTRFTKQNAK